MPASNRRSLVIPLLAGLIFLSVSLFAVYETSVRIRVDTPIEAVGIGEPGCVVAAAFTDRDGVERVADVRRYRANCIAANPGDSITVYYDASNPAVHSSTRSWWWSALIAITCFWVAWIALHAISKVMRGERMSHDMSQSKSGQTAPIGRSTYAVDRGSGPPVYEETPIPEDELGYYYDRALGQLIAVTDAVRQEMALPPNGRASEADDTTLSAVATTLEESTGALRGGHYLRAMHMHRSAALIVADQWNARAPLSSRILECRPILERLSHATG